MCVGGLNVCLVQSILLRCLRCVEKRKHEHKECENEEEHGACPGKNQIGNEGVDEEIGCTGNEDNIKKQREGNTASHSSDSCVVGLEDINHTVDPESNSKETAICLGHKGNNLLNNQKKRYNGKENKLKEIEHANKASGRHNFGKYKG